jgi:hypothetical protein
VHFLAAGAVAYVLRKIFSSFDRLIARFKDRISETRGASTITGIECP